MELCLSPDLVFCSPFYLGCFALYPGIACLGYVHYGISCLASQALICFPLLGVHPSVSIVKLIMIDYCCNCLDGQLNCQASVHWLIGVTTMYWLCYQWFGPNTISLWVLRDQNGLSSVLFQSGIKCHVRGPILCLTTSHSFLSHSLDVGFSFGDQWSGWKNCFWQDWLLTMTI